jgi:hypothetical protein
VTWRLNPREPLKRDDTLRVSSIPSHSIMTYFAPLYLGGGRQQHQQQQRGGTGQSSSSTNAGAAETGVYADSSSEAAADRIADAENRARAAEAEVDATHERLAELEALHRTVGLYKLNPVVTHSLKAPPGFNR